MSGNVLQKNIWRKISSSVDPAMETLETFWKYNFFVKNSEILFFTCLYDYILNKTNNVVVAFH